MSLLRPGTLSLRRAIPILMPLALGACLHHQNVASDITDNANPTFAESMCISKMHGDTTNWRLVNHSDFSVRVPPHFVSVSHDALAEMYTSGADTIVVVWGYQDPHAMSIGENESLVGQCGIDATDQSADVVLYRRTLVDTLYSPTGNAGAKLVLEAMFTSAEDGRQVFVVASSRYTTGLERVHDVLWTFHFKPVPAKK